MAHVNIRTLATRISFFKATRAPTILSSKEVCSVRFTSSYSQGLLDRALKSDPSCGSYTVHVQPCKAADVPRCLPVKGLGLDPIKATGSLGHGSLES